MTLDMAVNGYFIVVGFLFIAIVLTLGWWLGSDR